MTTPLHKELWNHRDAFLGWLAHNRDHLIQTGYPQTKFAESSSLEERLGHLYPIEEPFRIEEHDEGTKQIIYCYQWYAPSPKDLQQDRDRYSLGTLSPAPPKRLIRSNLIDNSRLEEWIQCIVSMRKVTHDLKVDIQQFPVRDLLGSCSTRPRSVTKGMDL